MLQTCPSPSSSFLLTLTTRIFILMKSYSSKMCFMIIRIIFLTKGLDLVDLVRYLLCPRQCLFKPDTTPGSTVKDFFIPDVLTSNKIRLAGSQFFLNHLKPELSKDNYKELGLNLGPYAQNVTPQTT